MNFMVFAPLDWPARWGGFMSESIAAVEDRHRRLKNYDGEKSTA
jgi:hypothetical protein